MATLDAIVDTGFTGFLTLPLSQIAQLGFSYEGIIDARLGDGRAAEFDMFAGTVLWDGYVRTGTALAETLHQSMTAIWAEVAFTHPSFKQVALALFPGRGCHVGHRVKVTFRPPVE